MKIRIIICLFSLLLSSCSIGTFHYFPMIQGKVTLNNQPVKNIKIEYFSTRGWTKITEYRTNDNGKFFIPLNSYKGLLGPHPRFIETRILIYFDDQIILGLQGGRDYLDNNKINPDLPLKLECELSNIKRNYIIPELNGDRYGSDKDIPYKYTGVCAYNKPMKQD